MKKVKELTVKEVVMLPSYQERLEKYLDVMKIQKNTTRIKSMINKGYFQPNRFKLKFLQILDKKEKELSHSQREIIRIVGMHVFLETTQKMLDDEKTEQSNN